MAKQAQNQNRVCAVGRRSQSWAQVYKASQVGLRRWGVCPWTVPLHIPRCLSSLVFENLCSRCLTPLHSHCCTLNESKLQRLIWTGGFGEEIQRRTLSTLRGPTASESHPTCHGASLRWRRDWVTELAQDQDLSWQSCSKSPWQVNIGNQFYLDCILCIRSFINIMVTALVRGQFTQASDLHMMFLRLMIPRGLCTCFPISFSHTSDDCLLLML